MKKEITEEQLKSINDGINEYFRTLTLSKLKKAIEERRKEKEKA